MLARIAGDAKVTTLRRFEFEPATSTLLQASALRGIRSINRQALIKEKTPAVATRILRDLTAFRLAVMEAVKPAAMWLVGSNDA